jgi:Ribosomal protein L9, N-terminal domain
LTALLTSHNDTAEKAITTIFTTTTILANLQEQLPTLSNETMKLTLLLSFTLNLFVNCPVVWSFPVLPAGKRIQPTTISIHRQQPIITTTSLSMAKTKKTKSASSSSGTSATQIQVKLLKHVAGTGQAGDVVLVNPAYFNNKLRPQHAAKIVSTEEVEAQVAAAQAQSQTQREQAIAWHQVLDCSNSEGEDDGGDNAENSYVLHLSDNKTGPDGHKLFGGIGIKKLYQELLKDVETKFVSNNNNDLDLEFLRNSKQVRIVDVIDNETNEPLVGDIKHVGSFRMDVVLLSLHHGQTTSGKKKGRKSPINAIPTTDDDEEEVVATVRVEVEGSN